MSVYGVVRVSDGKLDSSYSRVGMSSMYEPYLTGSFKAAVEQAEKLGRNCMVVELVPRANIRHERTHRTIIDPLL